MELSNTNKSNEVSLVETRREGNAIVVEFGKGVSEQEFKQLSNQLKEVIEVLHLGLERNNEEIKNVKKEIESKYITPQQLGSLESLVDKKARKFVNEKKGIQLDIDVLLNYDQQGLMDMQRLVNNEVGKTKQKIWIELNKDCLERKGTDPKNRILATQVDRAFDFVRSWGGFSV